MSGLPPPASLFIDTAELLVVFFLGFYSKQ